MVDETPVRKFASVTKNIAATTRKETLSVRLETTHFSSVEAWVQETGRGGRDRNQCTGRYTMIVT